MIAYPTTSCWPPKQWLVGCFTSWVALWPGGAGLPYCVFLLLDLVGVVTTTGMNFKALKNALQILDEWQA